MLLKGSKMEFKEGQKVEFTYHGTQDDFVGTRQEGTIFFRPWIEWQGGSVPVDNSEDVVLKEEK
jgi:hypothetical protein